MDLTILSEKIKGEVELDLLHRMIYATDASALLLKLKKQSVKNTD